MSSGLRTHWRLTIANGAVRAADVRATARERNVRPSNPSQNMAREMAHLRRLNARLQQDIRDKDKALQKYKVTTELTLEIYRELGMDIPENARQRLAAAQAINGSTQCSSDEEVASC